MTEQFEQAKREFLVSVMFSVTGEYNPQHPAVSKCLSDLTALLEQHKEVMMKYTEWIGGNANMLYFPNSNDKWLLSRLVKGENPSVEYDEYSTAELFNYWLKNVKK